MSEGIDDEDTTGPKSTTSSSDADSSIVDACSCDRTGLRAEFMVGYSYLRSAETNFNGWKTTLVGNVNHWLGVAADFDGLYAGAESEHSITCGPHFVVRGNEKLAPIGYALFRVAIKKSESGGTARF